jgi:diacylglycerol kinase (ATP)
MIRAVLRQTNKDIARLVNTTRWSLCGLQVSWMEEKSLRQWVAANVASLAGCMLLGLDPIWTALLVVLGGLVIIVELLNTAIEACVDYVSTDHHPLAKKAKDVASAAVFSSAILWVSVWVVVLVS